ncbi:MAG: hypothetical protein AAGH40_04405 [Verrucomicrobiota bacterium]
MRIKTLVVLCLSLPGIAWALPADWPTEYPDWWYNVDPALSLIDISKLSDPANGAPLVQGQLWFMADRGIAELNAVLGPVGGAGFDLSDFSNGQPSAYASLATVGQLKYISSKFFDRFAAIGFTPTDVGWPSTLLLNEGANDNSLNYPWLDDVTSLNASPAVIGQAKHLFSWDLSDYIQKDEDNDGVLDYIEIALNGSTDTLFGVGPPTSYIPSHSVLDLNADLYTDASLKLRAGLETHLDASFANWGALPILSIPGKGFYAVEPTTKIIDRVSWSGATF